MSIEAKIDALIEALNANTAAIKGAVPAKSAEAPKADTKPAGGKAEAKAEAKTTAKGKAKEKTVTLDELRLSVFWVKDHVSHEAAQKLIKDAGVTKFAEIPEEKWQEVYNKALALKKAKEEGTDDVEDDLGEDDDL